MIDRKRVLAEFFELARIYSPSFKERAICDLLKERLSGLGLDVFEDRAGEALNGEAGNLIARLPGSRPDAPVMLLSAHLDCVEPCRDVRPRLENGRIASSGETVLGADCRSGLVAILEALRVLKERNLEHCAILVVFSVAEEAGVAGARHIDREHLRADFGFALDTCGAPGVIITRAPGKLGFKIKLKGRKAHAGIAPEEGINAIMLAARALSRLKMGRVDAESTANVGSIRADGASNVVPDVVELEIEARSHVSNYLSALGQAIKAAFGEEAESAGASCEIILSRDYEPYQLNPDSPQVGLALEVMRELGLPAQLKATCGGSDANHFNAFGVPTAVLSNGMQKVHTTGEFIEAEHLYQTCELVLGLARGAAKLASKV